MAYFLKQSKQKGKTYLSICESFYQPSKKETAHKTFKSLGSLESLVNKGIPDPISYYKSMIDEMNDERKNKTIHKISNVSPKRYLGYFPIKSIMNKLNVEHYINYFNLTYDFDFNLYELLSSLVYARLVHPCSKHKTYHEVLPNLFETFNYSYDQLLDGLSFIGNEYEKFIEIFNVTTNKVYGLNTSQTYFDCTNFYFEIDRETDFLKKGPSKENRKNPILGLGLLLDTNQIPIAMKLYPGNQSEKPIFRDVIQDLKVKNNIVGKTIHVADKGLNCASNIVFSKSNNDGYLFSKSVKSLPEIEKQWILLKNDYKAVKDNKGNVLYYYKSCIDTFPYKVEIEGKTKTVMLKEKRLITYNPKLALKKRREINQMVEKVNSLVYSKAKRNEYGEMSKYVNFTDEKGDKACISINQKAIDKDLILAGYNLLVTSEINLDDQDIYNIYHNLWRIEESFRIMKTDLDARPVFLQKEETIKGHFLICYLAVLLERIFQFKVLKNEFSSSEVFSFFKGFTLTKAEYNYINTSISSKILDYISAKFKLPLTNYFLTDKKIEKILKYKI